MHPTNIAPSLGHATGSSPSRPQTAYSTTTTIRAVTPSPPDPFATSTPRRRRRRPQNSYYNLPAVAALSHPNADGFSFADAQAEAVARPETPSPVTERERREWERPMGAVVAGICAGGGGENTHLTDPLVVIESVAVDMDVVMAVIDAPVADAEPECVVLSVSGPGRVIFAECVRRPLSATNLAVVPSAANPSLASDTTSPPASVNPP